MRPLSNRTASFSDSVIRRMTRIANQYDAVNLSQGFPDFAPPKALTDRLAQVAAEGPHQYAITWGAQNFREALARKHKHFSGMEVNPNEEIVVTCGSTEAMMAAMMAIVNPGDKVAIFLRFMKIMEQILFCPGRSQFIFLWCRQNLILMVLCLRRHSGREPRH